MTKGGQNGQNTILSRTVFFTLAFFLLIMHYTEHFKTVKETLKFFDLLNSNESDILDVDVCIIPPNKSGNITENEDIYDKDFGEIILTDVICELHILCKDEAYDASSSHIRIEAENSSKSCDNISA